MLSLLSFQAHIGDILRSKFGDFKSFHTLLYTCAKEFDFLEWETYVKLTKTGLIPAMLVAVLIFTLTVSTLITFSVLIHDWYGLKFCVSVVR